LHPALRPDHGNKMVEKAYDELRVGPRGLFRDSDSPRQFRLGQGITVLEEMRLGEPIETDGNWIMVWSQQPLGRGQTSRVERFGFFVFSIRQVGTRQVVDHLG